MSLVKTGAVQIGQSNTASNNFHWRNLLDGLLRLSRGNAGDASPTDVMRVKADNSVEFPGGISGVLGAGQTWQDVTASRAAATNYTNTTGKPITICVSFNYVGNGTSSITVSGVLVNRFTFSLGGTGATMSAIIPAGSVYSAQGNIGIWVELR